MDCNKPPAGVEAFVVLLVPVRKFFKFERGTRFFLYLKTFHFQFSFFRRLPSKSSYLTFHIWSSDGWVGVNVVKADVTVIYFARDEFRCLQAR